VVTRDRIYLEQAHYASSTINLRLAAVRLLAYAASDAGLLSPDLAAGIRRVKGAKKHGVRLGNWLTRNRAKSYSPFSTKQAFEASATTRWWRSCSAAAYAGQNWQALRFNIYSSERNMLFSPIWLERELTSGRFRFHFG
jgi:hypothetical protein